MKLKDVKAERKKLTTTLPGLEDLGELNLTYIPGALTPEVEDQILEVAEQPGQGAFITSFLEELIEDWDLLDENDMPIPITKEALKPVPIQFLGQVLTAIRNDMNPGEEKGD
jgi:hypothetical protein